ncbi:MAG: (2Fe-2S)-binding protein [Planctomycetes bacterium]|nr:(2Fe-2S)-binding protein [Planctomycetota bacterium]
MPKVRIVERSVELDVPAGQPVLFTLWAQQVPVTSLCGGNASCGTCSAEIIEGLEHLDPPHEGELRVLARIKRQGPNVRLLCQACPRGDLVIRIKPAT